MNTLTPNEQATLHAISMGHATNFSTLFEATVSALREKGLVRRVEVYSPCGTRSNPEVVKLAAYSGTTQVLTDKGVNKIYELGLADCLNAADYANLVKVSKHKPMITTGSACDVTIQKSLSKLLKLGLIVFKAFPHLSTTAAGEQLIECRGRRFNLNLPIDKLYEAYFNLDTEIRRLKRNGNSISTLELLKTKRDRLRSEIECLLS